MTTSFVLQYYLQHNNGRFLTDKPLAVVVNMHTNSPKRVACHRGISEVTALLVFTKWLHGRRPSKTDVFFPPQGDAAKVLTLKSMAVNTLPFPIKRGTLTTVAAAKDKDAHLW